MTAVQSETVRFEASDGWVLTGDLFVGEDPRVGVLISAGTGFPRRFYKLIASHFAARGAVVLTFDYRGIDEAEPEGLAQSGITYTDWGRFDMPAALDRLEAAAPGLPLAQVGHSVGGQFAGLMPNHHKVARHAFLGVGSGFWGVHHWWRVPMELGFWWFYGPFFLAFRGVIPAGGLWGGTALPPDVFRTWRRWSQRRSYMRGDLESGRVPHFYDQVTTPICSWVFADDGIATPRAVLDTLNDYPNAARMMVQRNPAEVGVQRIGHEGAFRRNREALWDECWDWLVDGRGPIGAAPV